MSGILRIARGKDNILEEGRLFIVSGPSGAGKSSICEALYRDGTFVRSISMTTRARRGREIPGVSYYYVSDEEFQKTVEEDGFLEYAGIYGHRYGTPKAPVLKNLSEGRDVVLEIEMQGAMQAKKAYPEAIMVFILPPSMQTLRDRLIRRGTEDEEQLRKRMKESLAEIKLIKDYQYYIVNENLEHSIEELRAISQGGGTPVPEDVSEIVSKYEEEEKQCYYIPQLTC